MLFARKRSLVKFRNSAFRRFLRRHQKYAPVIFFVGGFIFDTLTLGRIDRLYDLVVLCMHMTLLTLTLLLYNLVDDAKWRNRFIDHYAEYFPLAIQFFFGGLSSAYVIYFSRSVSLSKTMSFFIILVALLLANEFLKKRISNKYLQFGVYFFVSFTFCTFMIPVFIKEMNTDVFLFSGMVSLGITLALIFLIYVMSPSTRVEIQLWKMIGIVLLMYATINSFYFLKLIPPVPIALEKGIAAHNIIVEDNSYLVTYEANKSHFFWRDHRLKFIYSPGETVYVFASIFAPTQINKSIFHRWKWYDENTRNWEVFDKIGYEITGGRDGGFRGYTYKNNIQAGRWKVEVITEEELVIGVINFEVLIDASLQPRGMVQKRF